MTQKTKAIIITICLALMAVNLDFYFHMRGLIMIVFGFAIMPSIIIVYHAIMERIQENKQE